jgi:hypothetical protein
MSGNNLLLAQYDTNADPFNTNSTGWPATTNVPTVLQGGLDGFDPSTTAVNVNAPSTSTGETGIPWLDNFLGAGSNPSGTPSGGLGFGSAPDGVLGGSETQTGSTLGGSGLALPDIFGPGDPLNPQGDSGSGDSGSGSWEAWAGEVAVRGGLIVLGLVLITAGFFLAGRRGAGASQLDPRAIPRAIRGLS